MQFRQEIDLFDKKGKKMSAKHFDKVMPGELCWWDQRGVELWNKNTDIVG